MINIERNLFKISGDLVYRKDAIDFVKEKASDKTKLIDLIYGFGSEFSKALNEAGIDFKYTNGIRETSEEGLKIGLGISNRIKGYLGKEFHGYNILLISPIREENGLIININGDDIIRQKHRKYNKIYVCTLEGRVKNNLKEISNLEMVYFK